MSNPIIAITGAGSGIGHALAQLANTRGYRLALADINLAALESLRTDLGLDETQCLTHAVDVSSFDAVNAWRDAIQSAFGGVDIVINNAGIALIANADVQSNEDIARVMDVNFWGVVHGSKAFLPLLRQSKDPHLVNVSSIFGIMAVPSQSAYNASKFAVRGYTEALRQEIEEDGIHVCCVHPGGIKTNIVKSATILNPNRNREQAMADFDTMAPTTPAQAAQTIFKAIDRRQKRCLIGRDAKWLSLLTRLFPVSYPRWLPKQSD
ncbi:MAG: SDR family NAD(P)-dependent oxidoreductase [Halieaceae bacterium]|nr:SDR family NAD(P)-dependent oxidoreductase [Halieaceae bacterium]